MRKIGKLFRGWIANKVKEGFEFDSNFEGKVRDGDKFIYRSGQLFIYRRGKI